MCEQLSSMEYEQQLEEKTNTLKDMLASLYASNIEVFASPPKHYRMRAEFRIWHQGDDTFHIMFDQTSKEKYKVEELLPASSLINNAMKAVISIIKQSPLLRIKLFQIDYLSSTTNELVISLLYHKSLDEQWQVEADKLSAQLSHLGTINIIGRAKKQKIVVGNDFVNESLSIKGRTYHFKQIENSFTQPNAYINAKMIEWVIDNATNKQQDLLELYCGAGNFSVPLSRHFNKVLATEISKTSVYAAQDNIQQNNTDNLTIARLSSEEFVQAFNKERAFNRLSGIDLDAYNFSTVLVDPPRAGLDPTTIDLVRAFDNIIYISCNPETLLNNLESLQSTHQVVKSALFDQFPFTKHIESGVILRKIS